MNLHETHILCEALERYRNHCPADHGPIVDALLERYTDDVCNRLTEDYREKYGTKPNCYRGVYSYNPCGNCGATWDATTEDGRCYDCGVPVLQ